MSSEYVQTGRAQQKLKTRARILQCAQELMAETGSISLEDVAKATGISRATMYRYFPNADILAAEVGIHFKAKTTDQLAEEVKDMPLNGALRHVQQYFNDLTRDHELAFRKFLSATLSESLKDGDSSKLRGARRTAIAQRIIDQKGSKLSSDDQKNLTLIMAVLSGIEPFIVNRDVNDMSNESSDELLHWALENILKGLAKD